MLYAFYIFCFKILIVSTANHPKLGENMDIFLSDLPKKVQNPNLWALKIFKFDLLFK